MQPDSTQFNIETLLVHEDFVRGLAKSVLFDDHRVDDVVQKTWLAALRSRPEQMHSERSWLATVARNLAFTELQKKKRIERREKDGARLESVPSTAEIVEKEAARKELVDLVVALEEPLRSTLLLRYYENLAPRQIAKRLGIPVEMVYAHQKRGLEKLRAALDSKHGGNRQAWCLGLVPIALPVKSSAVAVGAFAAVAALLLVGVTVWMLSNPFSGTGEIPSSPSVTRLMNPGELMPPANDFPQTSSPKSADETAAISLEDPASRSTMATPDDKKDLAEHQEGAVAHALFSGVVLDSREMPISGAEVLFFRASSSLKEVDPSELANNAEKTGRIRSASLVKTDRSGKFSAPNLFALPEVDFADEEERKAFRSKFFLFVREPNHACEKAGPFSIEAPPQSLTIRMENAGIIEGRVVSAEEGRPLAEMRVYCVGRRGSDSSRQSEFAYTTSDSQGRFRLSAIPYQDVQVVVQEDGYRREHVELNFVEGRSPATLELRLAKEAWEILGYVRTPQGRPVPDKLAFFFGENAGPKEFSYFSIVGFNDDPQSLLGSQVSDSSNLNNLRLSFLMAESSYQESDGSFRIFPSREANWQSKKTWVVLQAEGMKPQIRAVQQGDEPIEFVLDLQEIEKKLSYFLIEPVEAGTGRSLVGSNIQVTAFRQGEKRRIGAGVGSSQTTDVYCVPGAGTYDLLVRANGHGWKLLRGLSISDGQKLVVGKAELPAEARIVGKVKFGSDAKLTNNIVAVLDSEGREISWSFIKQDGSFALDRLAAERVRLRVAMYKQVGKGWQEHAVQTEVTMRAGETSEVEIVVDGSKN